VRYGFLAVGGAPLANGGTLDLAREAPYFDQPTGDYLALGLWFEVFGISVPIARARTVAWGVLALAALGWGAATRNGPRKASPALLPLAFGSVPIVAYYDHAAFPPAIAVSALAIIAGARLRRQEGAGAWALALEVAALVVVLGTTWKGILFASVFGASDLLAKRAGPGHGEPGRGRDGLLLMSVACLGVALEVGHLVSQGGAAAWLAKGALRAGSAGPFLAGLWRVARYGRGLGYGHVLLGLAWGAGALKRARRGAFTNVDRVTLELLLAPLPWYLVFRERLVNHDHELLYLAPGLALACWQVLGDLLARKHGTLRVVLAAAMLVVTGAGIASILEHKDDLTQPRELGAVARAVCSPDEAWATSSPEISVIWEADRFVHLNVRAMGELDALLSRGGKLAPRWFVIPYPGEPAERVLTEELRRRFPEERRGDVLVFDLTRAR